MKFHRLKIANFRGITQPKEIRFSPGLTVVQGPNESGKSSLAIAIERLFDVPVTSTKINAERHVYFNENPEIELEIESGEHYFTYAKHFNETRSASKTFLTIQKPNPENVKNKHDERLKEILEKTLDLDMWKAMLLKQGDAVVRPKVKQSNWLSTALDEAAAGNANNAQGEGLFAKVEAKFLDFYTEKQKAEKTEIKNSRKKKDDAQKQKTYWESILSELEDDIESVPVLKKGIKQLESDEDVLKKIDELAGKLEKERSALSLAKSAESAAQTLKNIREKLVNELKSYSEQLTKENEASKKHTPILKSAQESFVCAEEAVSKANEEKTAIDDRILILRSDCDFFQHKQNLALLMARKLRVDEARANSLAAEQRLSANNVTESVFEKIQTAEKAKNRAEDQLKIGCPEAVLRGLSDFQYFWNDEESKIGPGEERKFSVNKESELLLPGILKLEIKAGASADELNQRVDAAQKQLHTACKNACVESLDEAELALKNRRCDETIVAEKIRIEKDNLSNESYEKLSAKIEKLDSEKREQPKSADLESANVAYNLAVKEQKRAAEQLKISNGLLETARTFRDEQNTKNTQFVAKIGSLTEYEKQKQNSLEQARCEKADDVLDNEYANAVRSTLQKEADVRNTSDELLSKTPAKFVSADIKQTQDLTRNEIKRLSNELTATDSRIKLRSDESPSEKFDDAETEFERLEKEYRKLDREANAAKLLYEIMSEERNMAKKSRIAPLKERIEQLGENIFGKKFQIQLNDNLEIENRTIGNETVPFELLSGGTKEQLSILYRIACSMLVSSQGGMPLILDDALGYTDKERLPKMRAALAKAAESCQIIVLTCMPERYAGIAGAKYVDLGSN